MSERSDTIEMRGYGWTTQSFAVTTPGRLTTVVTLDKQTSLALARELTARAERMEDA